MVRKRWIPPSTWVDPGFSETSGRPFKAFRFAHGLGSRLGSRAFTFRFTLEALRLVSSLRMGAVTLQEERQSLTIDSPLAIADLCSEMRFLDPESLRVVLLDAKQHLIKIATVSQGTVNESLAHPREIFKPVITHSVYSFILAHNHPSGDPSPSEADLRLTRVSAEARRFSTRSVQALGRLYGPSAAASRQTALRTMALFEGAMMLARTLDDPKVFDDATRDLD